MSTSTPKLPGILRSPIDARKLSLARHFRRQPTAAEAAAWQLLRDRRILGLKFRRQQIIAGFIVDFYCASLCLALELDGGVHNDPAQLEYDTLRTQILAARAIVTLRIPNEHVNEGYLRASLLPYISPPLP